MNRFERKKQKLFKKCIFLLPAAAFLLLLVLFWQGITSIDETTLQKQQESLETAVTRSIIQCYATEGAYPPSLEYLTEHYGLTYNQELFFIDYRPVGSNIMPDVTIIRR